MKLKQGCPVRDCIPSIDQPQFESIEAADIWLDDDDVVFSYQGNKVVRAYPQRILNWHEIVNDEVEGVPIAVTFCPLCGSTLAFDRRQNERVLEFGVSGKLHNSDLVMYDRETESLWQQITGEAIVGELFEEKLLQLPMDTVRWGEWKKEHPSGEVLSRETGFSRDYSRYPYDTYEKDSEVYYPIEGGVDETIHPKTEVFGVVVGESAKAYTREALERETGGDGQISDVVGGDRLRLNYTNGELNIENLTSGEEVTATRLFWFAWKVFNKDTELYQ